MRQVSTAPPSIGVPDSFDDLNQIKDVFIFVDAVNGSDNKSGKAPAQAVKTFIKAMSLVPPSWSGQCKVKFAPGHYPIPGHQIFSIGVPNGPASTWCMLEGSYTNEVGTRAATLGGGGAVINIGGAALVPDAWKFYYVTVTAHGGPSDGVQQQRTVRSNGANSVTPNEVIKPVVGATSYTCEIQRGAAVIEYSDYNSLTCAGGGIGMKGLTFKANENPDSFLEMYAMAILCEGMTFIGANRDTTDFESHIAQLLPQNNTPWYSLPQNQRPFSADISWDFDAMDPAVPGSGQNLPACYVFINHNIYTDNAADLEGWVAFDNTYMYCGQSCNVELASAIVFRNSSIQLVESSNLRLPDVQFNFSGNGSVGIWNEGYQAYGTGVIGLIDCSSGATCNIDSVEMHSADPGISPVVLSDLAVANVGALSGHSAPMSPFLVKNQSLLKIDVPQAATGNPAATTITGSGAEVVDFQLQGVPALQTTYAAIRTADGNGVASVGGDSKYDNRATSVA